MSIKSIALAASVAAGLICTAGQADAQWRRGRGDVTYVTYPSYTYTPGVVYSSYAYPTYYTTNSGVVTTSYASPNYSSYYSDPNTGTYSVSPYSTWGVNNWGYSNLYGTSYGGVGTRGAAFGPWRVRW